MKKCIHLWVIRLNPKKKGNIILCQRCGKKQGQLKTGK